MFIYKGEKETITMKLKKDEIVQVDNTPLLVKFNF